MAHSKLLKFGKVELLLEEDEKGRWRLHANHLLRKQQTKEDIEKILTQIIAKAEDYNVGVLWLNSNGLEGLPDNPALRGRDFSKLKNLIQLALWDNKLTEFPEVLIKLKKLERLNISQNAITSIPASIKGMCISLKELWLGGNRIQNVPEDFCYLANLEILYLGHRQYKGGGNDISDLPKNFGQLKKLHTLYLFANKFRKFPEVILQLPNLRDLDMGKNAVRQLPEEIHKLRKLTMLKVDDNMLTELPNSLARLSNLFQLDVRGNNITILPLEFGKLSQLKIFDIKRNPLIQPPLDVCLQGVDRIKTYQEELAKSEPVSTVRRKVVLLGESFAGKTSMKNALQTGESRLTDERDRTQCMNIDSWASEVDGKTLEIRVCDFGGHDVYKLTHQFFLSEGSLHLLVVNLKSYRRRQGAFNKAVKFWLESVDSRVLNAVVYLVGTHADKLTAGQIEERTRDIKTRLVKYMEGRREHLHFQMKQLEAQIDRAKDEAGGFGNDGEIKKVEQLQRKVEKLQCQLENGLKLIKNGDMAVVSSKDLSGIDELKTEVFQISADSDIFPGAHCVLPKSWINLETLLKLKGKESGNITLSWEECVQLASKLDLDSTGMEAVLDYLHKTGSVLHYKGNVLQNVVFPEPTQLVTILKLIFDHDQERLLKALKQSSGMSAEEFRLVRNNFTRRAVLPKSVLLSHFSKADTTTDDFETTIDVLETFGITQKVPVPPRGTTGTAFLSPGDTYYRFPWFLPKSDGGMPSYVKQYWPKRVTTEQEQIGVEYRINGKEPTGLFERLCAQLPPHLCPGTDWSDGVLCYMGEQPVLVRRKPVDGGVKLTIAGRAVLDKIDDMWLNAIIPIVGKMKLLLKEWSRSSWSCSIPCPHCTKAGLKVLGYFRGELLWEERPDRPLMLRCPRPARSRSSKASRTSLLTKLVYPPKTVPTVAPTDVVVTPISSTSLEVTVGEIPAHSRPGAILGYMVTYTDGTQQTRELPLKDGQHTVTLKGLAKASQYTVTVAGFTASGVGKPSDPINVFTLEDVPSAPPTDVKAYAGSTSEIKVYWREPPGGQCNGVIRGYNVRYRRKNDVGYETMFTEATHAVLPNLELAKQYSIAVQAVTAVGEGPFSPPVVQRTLLDDPRDDVMEEVTDMLVNGLFFDNSRCLALNLGLTHVQFEEVSYSCGQDAREIKYQMIRKWKQIKGRHATVQSLCSALEALHTKVTSTTPAEPCRTPGSDSRALADHNRTLAEHNQVNSGQPWLLGGHYISLAKRIMDFVENQTQHPNNETEPK